MKENDFSKLVVQTGLSHEEISERIGYSVRTIYRWENGEAKPRNAAVKLLKAIAGERPYESPAPSFRFIDLFAGIGGLRRGFEPLGGECVFTSEWNKYAQQTYLTNYKCDHDVAGDITQIEAREIPDHDVLLAGFPCQPFSIAGVSKKNSLNKPHGFRCEAQGTLFFDVARIIEYHRPKAFLLENVKNLVNHDRGQTFKVIHRTLTQELGYQVQYRVIDAKSWVPQHRERIFIVGFRESNNFTFDDFMVPDPAKGPKLGTILHSGNEAQENRELDHKYLDKNGRVLDKYTLTPKLWNYLQAYAEKHRRKGNGFGCSVVGTGSVTRTLSARYYKDGSEILVEQPGKKNPRRLTPRECARLMGFDKPGESKFVIPVSDTQAYKQFGNAVVVPVVEAVARHMAPWLLEEEAAAPHRQKELWAVG
jgi:DNA (cytosine-5)-methyltransferase 1